MGHTRPPHPEAAFPRGARGFRTLRRYRRPLLTLHFWFGLACAPYLILYGVTALVWNHPGLYAVRQDPGPVFEADLPLLPDARPLARAEAVRDALGLFGHVPTWDLKQTDDGLRFVVRRPGRSYAVRAVPGHARVETTDHGVWGLLLGLHGMAFLPGTSLWALSWTAYTHLSILALFVAVASGGLAWWIGPQDRGIGGRLGVAGVLLVLALVVGLSR